MATLKKTHIVFKIIYRLKVKSIENMEYSAILSTLIKLLFVIKTFVLSTFEWLFYTCFTVIHCTLICSTCDILSGPQREKT